MRSIRALSFLLSLAMILTAVGCAEGAPSGDASSTAASKASSAVSIVDASDGDVSSSGASSDVASSEERVVYKETVYGVAAHTDKFYINGRTMPAAATVSNKQGMTYDHAAQALCFTADCEGDVTVQLDMMSQDKENKTSLYFKVRVDGVETKVALDGSAEWQAFTLPVAKGLARGEHVFEIYRCNEAVSGLCTLVSVTLTGAVKTYQSPKRDLKMVFLGDSITCGSGVLGTKNQDRNEDKDATLSFAFLCGQKLNADFYLASRSGCYANDDGKPNSVYYTYNYVSKRRDATLYDNTKEADVNIYVISLGTNDVGTGNNFSNELIASNIQKLLTRVRTDHPKAKIVWTYGQMTTNRINVIKGAVDDFAATDGNIYWYQYTQTNTQGGVSHPTAEAQARDAEELYDFITTTVLN